MVGDSLINDYSFSIQTLHNENSLSDESNQLVLNTIVKPNNWFSLEMSYEYMKGNETFHFLMVREPHEGIERNYNDILSNNLFDDQQYLFTSLDVCKF